MVPTLLVGDHMFADKRARTPGRGDVVVFKYPKQPEKDFVKRVIAVGGDTIELKADGSLVLNGQPVARTHVDAPCEYDEILEEDGRVVKRGCEAWDETLDGRTYRVYLDRGRRERAFAPVSVGNDAYYVLGDNRDNSHDSRYWGMVPADHIRATARNLWFSYGPAGVRWDRLNLRIR
jgi:signal peptidase I